MFDPETDFATKTFMPYAYQKFITGFENDIRFVHYSSADAAKNILATKEVWFRKTSCMNDFMEVEHGIQCLARAYSGPTGDKLKRTVNEIASGAVEELENLFSGWVPHFHEGTYVVCFSEHLHTEDEFGRLSMWRAYGKDAGVAFVFKNTPFFRTDNTLNVFSSPVAYFNDSEFASEFEKIYQNIDASKSDLEKFEKEKIVSCLFNAFLFAAVCTKHPGFQEELEWRIIYCPKIFESPFLYKSVETINGHPQIVYKLPLKNRNGTYGIEIPEILDRVIIGPSDNAFAVKEALAHLLEESGFENPEGAITISDIPLR